MRIVRRLRFGLTRRRLLHLGLQRTPLLVIDVELAREVAGQHRILGRQQPRAEVGPAHAPAGIHARPEQEGGVVGIDPVGHARDVAQALEAEVAAPRHHLQPLRRQGAVQADQRHHVAHRSQRHQVQPLQQVGLRPRRAEPAAPPEHAVGRDHHQEHDTDGGEGAMRGALVQPVRVDHRERGRQRRLGDVMVGDDDVEPDALGLIQRREGGDAAIDRDDEGRALGLQSAWKAAAFGP